MEDEKPKISVSFEGFDPLGLKSFGEISKQVVDLGVDSVKTFLSLTCKPLLEELGLAGKDYVRNWRLSNILKMLEKAQAKLQFDPEKEQLVIDPRVAFQIAEQASTSSNDTLQDMWAGLFASSCNSYEEDENIFFIDILKRLTSSQVKLIKYLCTHSAMSVFGSLANFQYCKESGNVQVGFIKLNYSDILDIMGTTNSMKADSEINALFSMSLIEFPQGSNASGPAYLKLKSEQQSNIRPSITSLLLYIKCMGSNLNPFMFYLESVKSYYYTRCKDFVNITLENSLEKLYKLAIEGQKYDNRIRFSNDHLELISGEWNKLQLELLTDILRSFMIFKSINGLNNKYQVLYETTCIGLFSYQRGFSRMD